MGGRYSQGYALFVNLTVKAFLAIRPHAEQIANTVHLMLGTGLPSFKGEGTIKRLRDRFALHLNEREAADYMVKVIKNAYENFRSTAYDEFQRVCLQVYLLHVFTINFDLVAKWLVIDPIICVRLLNVFRMLKKRYSILMCCHYVTLGGCYNRQGNSE